MPKNSRPLPCAAQCQIEARQSLARQFDRHPSSIARIAAHRRFHNGISLTIRHHFLEERQLPDMTPTGCRYSLVG